MQPLHLKAADYKSISDLTDDVNGLSVLSAISYHADLKLVIDDVSYEREKAKLVENGGRSPQRVICIPPDTYDKLFAIAFLKSVTALQILLKPSGFFSIVLRSCRFTATVRRKAVKGETVTINMDTLVDGKDVTITALDANDVVLSDPTPQTETADSAGLARVEMIIPASYSGNKIKFRIDKKVVAVDEYGTHDAVSDDSEVHEITVT